MKILVSNIGSTSFKFRLFDMTGVTESCIAVGGADRIGSTGGVLKLSIGDGDPVKQPRDFADHGEAIRFVLDRLVAAGALTSPQDLDAVGFKAVMAGDYAPVALVTDELIERMEYFFPVAPAHNPPYVEAMRMFAKVLGDTPLVAAFEPGFHQTMPARRRHYAVPVEWAEKYGVKRYGFHGASHRYISTRLAELVGSSGGKSARVVSCHLGGSSSLCAIVDGKSVACSLGLSPQSGLPQSNRAGDFDVFALPLLASQAGMDTEQVLEVLGCQSGLAALSGTSGDIRDILAGIEASDERAQLAMDVYTTSVRDYLGAYMVEMGGIDAIVFTGGIGQFNPEVRTDICRGLEFAGITLDETKNKDACDEGRIDSAGSSAAIWVIPTNEELIVARQTAELLAEKGGQGK